MLYSVKDKCMFLQEYIFGWEATIPNLVHSENMSDCWRPSKRVPTMWYWYSEQIPYFYSQGREEQENLQKEKA